MLIIIGLILLIAALIVAVAGVLGNGGSAHPLGHGFAVLGYHVTGSAGSLFLAGIVVGAAGLLGLSLLLAGARRTSRRGSSARRSLQQSRRETAAVSQDRDDLISQRDAARAGTASSTVSGEPERAPERSAADRPRNGLQLLGRRFTSRQAGAGQPDPVASQPDPNAAADPAVPDEPASSPASVPEPVSAD
jgi:hypothetical protein